MGGRKLPYMSQLWHFQIDVNIYIHNGLKSYCMKKCYDNRQEKSLASAKDTVSLKAQRYVQNKSLPTDCKSIDKHRGMLSEEKTIQSYCHKKWYSQFELKTAIGVILGPSRDLETNFMNGGSSIIGAIASGVLYTHGRWYVVEYANTISTYSTHIYQKSTGTDIQIVIS